MRTCLLFLLFWLLASITGYAQSPSWEEQDAFVNGYARVFHADHFSFIDTRSKLISPFHYDDARNFQEGLAAVGIRDKWGFIDRQGRVVIPLQYDIVFDFSGSVAVVSRQKKWWLADQQGRLIRQLDISVCYGFKDGRARVEKNGRKGWMDRNGNLFLDETAVKTTPLAKPYYPSNTNSVCPPNLDFENGNFTNWNCYIGTVDSVGTTNVITLNPSPPTPGRHTIYARAAPSAIDPFGLFPTNPPDGSQFAVKLGNTGVGAQAERIRYVVRVPQNDSNFSFRYHYAVVLQDPGHTTWTQPRFTAKLFDSTTNSYIPCASFEYISTSNLPGFMRSTVDPSVIYKTWSPVFISLRGYAGKTLYLEFTTADCVRRAHWGYAYVDVENTCGQTIQAQYNCDTPHVTTLTGPPGFQFYNWWDQNYTTILGTGQTVTLNPGPPPNTLIWLEMIPFANFGCTDTLPVRVTGVVNAHFDASDTLGICAPHSFTFYNRNLPSTVATWDFGDGTTGTGDTVTHTFLLPGTYIVTMWVTQAGSCTGMVKDTVRVIQPTASLAYTGGNFCTDHLVQFTATTSNIDSLYWDFGDGTFLNTTQTTVTHNYTQPGIYIPRLLARSVHGCQILLPGPDTIRIEKLRPGYSSNIQNLCSFTPVIFTDTSYAFFGVLTRSWDFGDGTIATGSPVSHTYTVAGTYAVKLVITGVTGCKDSIIKNIVIQVHQLPVASIAGPVTACANTALVFNGSVVSADPVSTMNWSCTNGATGTGNSFPVSISIPGLHTVQLIAGTIFGCFDTTLHNIDIRQLPVASIGVPATVCQFSTPPPITFLGLNGTAPYIFTYSVNGGPVQTIQSVLPGNTVTIPAPTNVAGSFNYQLINVRESSALACGQPQNGSALIRINPLPTATISGSTDICLNAPSPLITFTGAGSVAPYTFEYILNGGPVQTITTVAGNSISIPVPTNSVGVFTYSLVRVTDGSSTVCSQLQSGTATVTVKPLPTATISGDQTVCMNAPSPQVVFTGSGGTAPYTFQYTVNGGPILTITTVTGNSASLSAPTSNSGTILYRLIGVQEGSATACSRSLDDSVLIRINPLPDASIGYTATVCLNSPSPPVTFLGLNGVTPYTFTYRINNGPLLTAVSAPGGNTVTLPAPTNVAGTFVYKLVGVQEGSPTACNQLLNDSIVIRVNPLPSATVLGDTMVCINAPSPSVRFTASAGTAPYTFRYSVNGGPVQTSSTTAGNSVTINAPTNIPGIFLYTLLSVQDASSTLCVQAQTGTATVEVQAPPPVNAGIDRQLCLGSSVQLRATGAAQYTWSPATGLSCTSCPDPVANPADTIQYIVMGTSAIGCIAFDTVKVNVIKPFRMQASPDDTLCLGGSVNLQALGASRYLWWPSAGLSSTTAGSTVATPQSTTIYHVAGYDAYGCFTDTAHIKITVGPVPVVDAGPDLHLSTGDVVTLNPTVQNGPIVRWLWEPATGLSCADCPTPRLTIHEDKTYTLTVTTAFGCVASDFFRILTFCKSSQVFIPNAFTPDGDGLNDVLMVRGKGIRVSYFRVFNRWGELIFEQKNFEPNDARYGWDGRIRGVLAPPDVFVYTAEVVCDNNVLYTLKGNTSLLK